MLHAGIAKTPKSATARRTDGGRIALIGFLFQILRSVQLGLRVTATEILEGDRAKMRLQLEPDGGGDQTLTTGDVIIVEQIKRRAKSRVWSSGELAREVFPDFARASRPGTRQTFRFVTDNAAGLVTLKTFLADRKASERADSATRYAWGRSKLTAAAFEDRLAASAGPAVAASALTHLLDNLEVEVLDPADAAKEVDRLLSMIVSPDQQVADKRYEMIGRLTAASSEGRTLTANDLLEMIAPDAANRLALTQNLPAVVRRRVSAAGALLGYDASRQSRSAAPTLTKAFTVISGESGQGKTWSLCQVADEVARTDGLVVLVTSATSVSDVERAINSAIWLDAYGSSVSPQVMARRLRTPFAAPDGTWLTLCIDDVQDRAFAKALAGLDWSEAGVRIVISAQPRIRQAVVSVRPNAQVIEAENFTSAELRRFLDHHERDASLETMPDDVFELLLKPIHARIFADLPVRTSWLGVTEYELFKGYWDYVGARARSQQDHPRDRVALAALAGSLLGDTARYPWPVRDLTAHHLDDAALGRLVEVGLLRRLDDDQVSFASDRMLNWAVAEWVAVRVQDERWPPQRLVDALKALDRVSVEGSADLGRRLGYVFLDLLWLLSRTRPAAWLAEYLEVHLDQMGPKRRQDAVWRDQLGSVGPSLLPALEALAARLANPHRSDVRRGLPHALAAIAQGSGPEVSSLIGRLIGSSVEEVVAIGLDAARRVATPEWLDVLWGLHLIREHRFEDLRASGDPEAYRLPKQRRDASFEALKMAIHARPTWLDHRLGSTTEPFELNHLLWVLNDADCVDDDTATDIWLRRRDHLIAHVRPDSKAMVDAQGRFGDSESLAWLSAVPIEAGDHMADRVLSSRARLSPEVALQQLRGSPGDNGWITAGWWIEELAHAQPDALSSAVETAAARGDDPLTDVVLFYANHPDLIGDAALERVLDGFTSALEVFNAGNAATPNAPIGRLVHPLRFLPRLVHVRQFEALARRAGTGLEAALLTFTTRRTGRVSRSVDTEGRQAARLLAMINGEGYPAMVASQLRQANSYAREDGLEGAMWSDADIVRDALIETVATLAPDSHGHVLQMQALAVHRADAALEAMLKAGGPIYRDAADMRRGEGRSTKTLLTRIRLLIAAKEINLGARLAAFLKEPADVSCLLAPFLQPDLDEAARDSILAAFEAAGVYDPSVLPGVLTMMETARDSAAAVHAIYLAHRGDAEARRAVVGWLSAVPVTNWPSDNLRVVDVLLAHADSAAAALGLVRRLRDQGRFILGDGPVLALAADGDTLALDQLQRRAFQRRSAGGPQVATAIRHLAERDRDEAFFAARRYLTRTSEPEAISVLLEVDPIRAGALLIERFLLGDNVLRGRIARGLRAQLAEEPLRSMIDNLARSTRATDQAAAAALAGWMPPTMKFLWLDRLARSGAASTRKSALKALRNRSLETSAMAHLALMGISSRALRRARLATVFECVEPRFLLSDSGPASLRTFLDENPPEFGVEAEDLFRRRVKVVNDEEKKSLR